MENPNCSIVDIGCGLDTRRQRIEVPESVSWYDVDYPRVIKLREHFLPQNCRHHLIGGDLTNRDWLIDGPINGERFLLYVEKVLAPTLQPGDIVVMDNLGSHKGKAVRRAIRQAGAKLFFLAEILADLNPIEQLFAKLKHWLRKAAKRTVETVCEAIGHALNSVTPVECSMANSGSDRR